MKKKFDWLLEADFQKLREGFEPVDNREFMDEDKHEEVEESAFSEEPNKGKDTPYTNNNNFSLDQVSTFWRIFGELEDIERCLNPGIEVDGIVISGEKLQDALVVNLSKVTRP